MDPSFPIGPVPYVLRRIPKNMVNVSLPQPILLTAFRPSRLDQDGLSCYRAEATTPQAVSQAGRKPGEYFVVRLSIDDPKSLNLTVVASDLPDGPPGHVVIPEITWSIYQTDKLRLRPILSRLAKLASQGIVFFPDK